MILLVVLAGLSALTLVILFRLRRPRSAVPSPAEKKEETFPHQAFDWHPVFEQLEEGIIICRKEGHILWLNQKARQFLGLKPGPPPNLFDLLRDQSLEEAVKEGKELKIKKDFYWPAHRFLELNVFPLDSACSALILRDITPFKRLSEVRRDFIAHLAHEFRTPLTAIEGYAENLLEEAPEELKGDLHIVLKNARRLSKLLKDLQVLSRLELQGIPAEDFETVELKEVIWTALETLFPEAARKDVTLKFTPPQEMALTRASFDDLLRAFINLIENAIKFSPRGGMVEIRLKEEGPWWKVSIKDQGPGIPDSEKERVFERFYRGKFQQKGTGLGLAIVKHVIKAHQGRIEVESVVGQGTIFYVYLPQKARL
ncbi:MAG TPA: PAS domain-containing protein [Thermodesulfatator atlanticus]|uniref:histidine kinase n=1 Tax=Thermodesulfatator atlanticus TaxID=501497 RepID=A0A7V5U2E9_9BACT|nr:PAS domain-containing protein [Thermodesulfatator atlanticus]